MSLRSAGNASSYVNFVQGPAGITEDEATELVLETASQDVPHEGYLYGGGSYALENWTIRFVIDLEPGEWHVAASCQAPPGEGEEMMGLIRSPVDCLLFCSHPLVLSPGGTSWVSPDMHPRARRTPAPEGTTTVQTELV